MFDRLSRLAEGFRGIVREFFQDTGMLGSVVAFAVVFGILMVAVVTLILVAGLLA
jgi:hypothetical protein